MSASTALFCYGTLCIPDIMRAVSGYREPGEAARLDGFRCVSLHGRRYPAIICDGGAGTDGILYDGLMPHQLQRIDRYEDSMYIRKRVQVRTVRREAEEAWTYVLHPRYHRSINNKPWSLDEFTLRYQAAYQHQHGW